MTSKSNKSKKGSKSGGKSTSKSQEKKESESKKKEEDDAAANAAQESQRTGREDMLPEGPSEPQIKEKGWFTKTNIQSFIHSYIQEKLKV